MGRLVDIDAVIKAVDRHTKDESEVVLDNDITCILEEVPTAYDVEKVVAEMKERVEKFDCIKCKHYDDEKYVCNAEKSCRDYTFECLYDIVKKGGVK